MFCPRHTGDELESLRTDASHVITAQIREIISDEYGAPWNTVFQSIKPFPLGAASVSQVHEAYLLEGTRVAVKVVRPNAYQQMERDSPAAEEGPGILRFSSMSKVVDLTEALDEMWETAKDELNMLQEAENIERLQKNLTEMKFCRCPAVFHDYTTKNVLVMEYIGGYELNDYEGMKNAGYSLQEVCQKVIRSYIKQFSEDRFFHADPHSGNIRVQNGELIWLDMGMMGTLSEEMNEAIFACMHAILKNDSQGFADGALRVCGYDPETFEKREQLGEAFKDYVERYRSLSIGDMRDSIEIVTDIMQIAKSCDVKIPREFTMYSRSLFVMEGIVADLDADTDLVKILGKYLFAQSAGTGMAAELARKIAHKRLVAGAKLRYNEYVPSAEEIYEDEKSVEEEIEAMKEEAAEAQKEQEETPKE